MWRLITLLVTATTAFEPPGAQPSPTTASPSPEDDFAAALSLRATDLTESMRLLQRAAHGGHAESQAVIGLAHAQGHGGLVVDSSVARKWLRSAASQGHADATFNLVVMCDAVPSCLKAANTSQALDWLEQAASQGSANAAYEAALLLLEGGDATPEIRTAARTHFLSAARSRHAKAMYNVARLLYEDGAITHAVVWFGRAANQTDDARTRADAATASKSLRRLWVQRAEAADIDESSVFFEEAHAAAAQGRSDAADAPGHNSAADMDTDDDRAGVVSYAATEALALWGRGASAWRAFMAAFEAHPSYTNAAAIDAMRRAMVHFGSALKRIDGGAGESADGSSGGGSGGSSSGSSDSSSGGGRGSSELQRYLLLSRLAEGAKFMARDDRELESSAQWMETIVREPLCAELYAEIETNPSCFNDQLASAITAWRRLRRLLSAHDAQATATEEQQAVDLRIDGLVARGNAHPHAATKWVTAAQTPRVFLPHLEHRPWWDTARFGVSARLEAAWTSGELTADMGRIDDAVRQAAADGAVGEVAKAKTPATTASSATAAEERGVGNDAGVGFERIVSSGAPIRASAVGDDADAVGVWSEFMLFNGSHWLEERCAAARTLCAVLQQSAEVAGEIVGADGSVTPPQGQVTIFRLKPGGHVLPHVGVTNRRLVLQFPLRGWAGVAFRVDEEWRPYTEGRAMVFDDSFEHEVVHGGTADRFVLYAVLHHPDLGTPTLSPPQWRGASEEVAVAADTCGVSP